MCLNYLLPGLLLSLVFLSSCIKYHRVLKDEFPQGEDMQDQRVVAYNYIRTARVYDQFLTEGIFDVLFMSDQVRQAYATMFATRRGLRDEEREKFQADQLKDGEQNVVFYVLADIRTTYADALDGEDAYWSFYIRLNDGRTVAPTSVKQIDIQPEIATFFKHRFVPCKASYVVTFSRQVLGSDYDAQSLTMIINSPTKRAMLVWDPADHKDASEIACDEDRYWS